MGKDREPINTGLQISDNGYEVTIRELTAEVAAAAREDRDFVSLGDLKVEIPLNALLGQLRAEASQIFLLSWEGNKIPRGIRINDSSIAWTQNGVVTSTDGEMIGTYDRLTEFGGDSGKLQRMLIFPFPNGS